MTDEFEQAVRRAAHGLNEGLDRSQPTYHDAWQRGRRRRLRKQVGLAVAGACVLFGALTVNLGDFGSRSVEVSEVAIGPDVTAVEQPAAQFVPTTAPLTAPTDDESSASSLAPAPVATLPAASAAEAPPESADPTEQAPAAIEAAPTVAPTAEAAATGPAPTSAASTSPSPTTTLPPAAGTDGPSSAQTPEPTTPPDAAFDTSPAPTPDDGAATQTTPTEPGTDAARTPEGTDPQAGLPNILLPGPNQRADAVVLDELALSQSGTDAGVPCDIDRDGLADATCTLKPAYACTDAGDAKPGYLAVDFDEDGAFDQCVAVDTTACDTTGDGLADTQCTIELLPAEADPEGP